VAHRSAVGSLRILSREGERLTVSARTTGTPFTMRFEAELRDGWCLMRSRLYLVGMAAMPLGEQTRYLHLEGPALPSRDSPAPTPAPAAPGRPRRR
jgi:hypothetical protein